MGESEVSGVMTLLASAIKKAATTGAMVTLCGACASALGAAYAPPADVTLVTRDSTEDPAPNTYSICYVNGFQTQPQERDRWLNERKNLLLADSNGNPVIDSEWPDEFLLDTSTPDKRTRLADITDEAIRQCARRGFKAVDVDNLDSYSRSGGRLTIDHNLAYATLLTQRAHGLGLAIGQKNSAEASARARGEVGFDFAVTEECHRYAECSSYSGVYGDHVMTSSTPTTCGEPSTRYAAIPTGPPRRRCGTANSWRRPTGHTCSGTADDVGKIGARRRAHGARPHDRDPHRRQPRARLIVVYS
jgi:hypothetical protein